MSNWIRKTIVALFVVALGISGGCASVTLVPVGTGPVAEKSVAAAGGPRHDLAVISLDFNPPLRMLQIDKAPANLALLVAVDNKGTFTEREVAVVVEVRAESAGEVLVRKQETISSIAPGKATVVKFAGFPSIPPRGGYTLVVSVDAVPGETEQTNNTTVMPLQLALSN